MNPGNRIGDAERERATADLSRHYTDGRLDHEEYDERLDAIWSARTMADLGLVFHDLPSLAPVSTTLAKPARRPNLGRLPLLPILFVLIGLSLLLEAPVWLLIFPTLWLSHRIRRNAKHRPKQGAGS